MVLDVLSYPFMLEWLCGLFAPSTSSLLLVEWAAHQMQVCCATREGRCGQESIWMIFLHAWRFGTAYVHAMLQWLKSCLLEFINST